MAAEKVPMTQRRAEQLSFIVLKNIFYLYAHSDDGADIAKGLTDDDFFNLMWLIAPELMTQIAAQVKAEREPVHFNEVIQRVGEMLRADAALPHRGSECPTCKAGILELPAGRNGMYDFHADHLVCTKCKAKFPRPKH